MPRSRSLADPRPASAPWPVRSFRIAVLAGLLAGTISAAAVVLAQSQPAWRALDIVLAALDRNYLWEVDRDALLEGAVAGAVEALGDPFTAYVPAGATAILEENRSGRFGGIGARFGKAAGEPAVVTLVYEGLPAHAAGLRAGDRVHSVDDSDIAELTLEETIELVRGREGDPVTFAISRGDESLVLAMPRAVVDVPVVTSAPLPGDVWYVSLSTFENRLVIEQLRERLAELQAAGARGLVLDLRGNGGGFLAQGVAVADEFMSHGDIAYTRSKGVTRLAASADPHAVDLPLVVLIDEASASASEIVAAALQDHGRALVVGRTSFGKGVGQELLPLPNGAELKYVTFEWLRPTREGVHEVGVTPDVLVAEEAAPPALSGTGFPPHARVTVEYDGGSIEVVADARGRLAQPEHAAVGSGVARPGEAHVDLERDAVLRAGLEALGAAPARARL